MKRNLKFRAWDNKLNCWIMNTNKLPFSIIGEVTLFDILRQYSLENLNAVEVTQFTGIVDMNKQEIYANDLLQDEKGDLFRVYDTIGGFVVKSSIWDKNLGDLIGSDMLILQPLSDAQNISYIEQSCKIVGNIYEHLNQ
jgi:hypothetical protein